VLNGRTVVDAILDYRSEIRREHFKDDSCTIFELTHYTKLRGKVARSNNVGH
jgi:hypothetical protein